MEGKITGSLNSDTVSTRLQRIADLAREAPERAFLSLAHHIDVEFLQEAFRRTRKDGATGVDGETGEDYEERLEENLQSLLDRFKSGRCGFRRCVINRLAWQHEQLVRKLRGHDNYYGLPGNSAALYRFRYEVRRLWRKWLARRSHKAAKTWARFQRLEARFPLPSPVRRIGLVPCAANP